MKSFKTFVSALLCLSSWVAIVEAAETTTVSVNSTKLWVNTPEAHKQIRDLCFYISAGQNLERSECLQRVNQTFSRSVPDNSAEVALTICEFEFPVFSAQIRASSRARCYYESVRPKLHDSDSWNRGQAIGRACYRSPHFDDRLAQKAYGDCVQDFLVPTEN